MIVQTYSVLCSLSFAHIIATFPGLKSFLFSKFSEARPWFRMPLKYSTAANHINVKIPTHISETLRCSQPGDGELSRTKYVTSLR